MASYRHLSRFPLDSCFVLQSPVLLWFETTNFMSMFVQLPWASLCVNRKKGWCWRSSLQILCAPESAGGKSWMNRCEEGWVEDEKSVRSRYEEHLEWRLLRLGTCAYAHTFLRRKEHNNIIISDQQWYIRDASYIISIPCGVLILFWCWIKNRPIHRTPWYQMHDKVSWWDVLQSRPQLPFM